MCNEGTGDSKTLGKSKIGEKDRVISGLVSCQLFEDTGLILL
jgi:hypothetical protein